MNFPANLQYCKSHEWVKDLGGGLFEIGISDYAQKELGDIVYINLPKAGDELKEGVSFAEVESVKAVSEILSPINGIVREVNDAVISSPDSVNKTPYEAWFIRAEGSLDKGSLPEGTLLSAAEYENSLK